MALAKGHRFPEQNGLYKGAVVWSDKGGKRGMGPIPGGDFNHAPRGLDAGFP